MVHLITPRYQRRRFFRPKRRFDVGGVWRVVRRYQLLELIVLTGAIALVWFGAHWDNQRNSWIQLHGIDMESARVQADRNVRGG
ncbi:MAG: hypothetical protein R3D30_01760 [Hyphomicrobiales bacterium]